MPIAHSIHHQRKLVVAQGRGTLTGTDISDYQKGVWSDPEIACYDELVDMTHVEHIALESIGRVYQLAQVSAAMDQPSFRTKFAIIAADDMAFGLGRMYQTYRALDSRSTKEVGVFRSWDEALAFLGCNADPKDLAPAGKSGS